MNSDTDNPISLMKRVIDVQVGAENKVSSIPPAIRVALTGQHLIEASAGTGKTWTLTGILLRLLIEGKRPPEHIIATTFTRAAAAELRDRVHQRLTDFHHILLWLSNLNTSLKISGHGHLLYPDSVFITGSEKDKDLDDSKSNTKANKDKDISPEFKQQRKEYLKEQAKRTGISDLVDDPINLHLIEYLLDNVTTYSLQEATRRTLLVLATLDKLFINTLDSLAQKWLTEYSAETGHQVGMAVSDSEQETINSIIHDKLRQFQSRLYHEEPDTFEYMQQCGGITTVESHQYAVNKALTFMSVPIDNLAKHKPFDFMKYKQTLIYFANLDLQEIEPYFDEEYRKSQKFSKASVLGKNIGDIAGIQQKIKQHGKLFTSYLSKDETKLYHAVNKAFPNEEGKITGFNKGSEKFHRAFISLDVIATLKAIHDMTEALADYCTYKNISLSRDIALSVRHKLPNILEERNETTFSLQMVRLNQALAGRQGQKLARYIRHHYPVALIDESQDINGEQAKMIEHIYMPSMMTKTNVENTKEKLDSDKNKSFLLLVGDPKQAIYGFRGGDVANYNHMKQKFDKNIMTLTVNRRSNVDLVQGLNHWFGCSSELLSNANKNNRVDKPKLAELGSHIHYQYIDAHRQQAEASWLNVLDTNQDSCLDKILPKKAVSILHLPYDVSYSAEEGGGEGLDEFETVALHIKVLLSSNKTISGRAIQPSDIGVLGRTKAQLKYVEDMLIEFDVPTLKTAEVNIFETKMAMDLAVLFDAMLFPQRRSMINRVLTSNFFRLNLRQVKTMMASHEGENDVVDNATTHNLEINANSQHYQRFITYIKDGAERWSEQGILAALHYLFSFSPLTSQDEGNNESVWQRLASQPEGKRDIMDLRQLMEILAQYTLEMGEHELVAWFKQNMDVSSQAKVSQEWKNQHPLPTESGVQLMTIHKSKGLEFPIVYVVGMDKASKKSDTKQKQALYLYHAEICQTDVDAFGNQTMYSMWQRRLSATAGSVVKKNCFADEETQEAYSELKRLGYVAFTRASEQLYIVLRDPCKNTDSHLKPMYCWLELNSKEFSLPERLIGKVGWLRGEELVEYCCEKMGFDKKAKKLPNNINIPANTTMHGLKHLNSESVAGGVINYINYPPISQVIKQTHFVGWAKTSFTALARQLPKKSQDIAVIDERVDDAIQINNTLNSISSDDIRFSFVRGANAGTFLHQIYEEINFTHREQWSGVIDKAVREYQLSSAYASPKLNPRQILQPPDSNNKTVHEKLLDWIDAVLDTPLLASNQPLRVIKPHQRFAELGFNMGLSETFKPEQINQVFADYLQNEPDKHIALSVKHTPHIYRYLRGEIDLVYECAGKYYVVDYKSNHLGNSLSDYSENNLKKAMSKAGYWLQAAIYQVALHRFLSLRITDYIGNEDKYLGAVEYVFLRGTTAQAVDGNIQRFGLVTWDIPIAFIKALDDMLGTPKKQY